MGEGNLTREEMIKAIEQANAERQAKIRAQNYNPYANVSAIPNPPPQGPPGAVSSTGLQDYRSSVTAPNAGTTQDVPYDWNDLPYDAAGLLGPAEWLASQYVAGMTGKRYGTAKILGAVTDAAGIDTSQGLVGSDPSRRLQPEPTETKPDLGQATGDLVTSKGAGTASKPPGVDLGALLPQSGSPTVIPGHEVRKVSPLTEQMSKEALGLEGQAIKEKTQAELRQTEAEKEIALRRQQYFEDLNKADADREAKRDQIIDQHLADQAKTADEIRSFKINPERAFGEGVGGVISRISSMIAIGLGGFASGLKGGPNQALQIIDSMIDRDIDAQKAELRKKHDLLGEQRTLLGQKMQQFGREDVAANAARSDMLNAAEAWAQGLMSEAKSDVQRANGTALLAGLAEKKAKVNDAMFAWQGPTVGIGDPRIKRVEEMTKEFVTKKVAPDWQTAHNMAIATVYQLPGVNFEISQKGAGGGGRMQALVSRDANLAEIANTLKAEIAATKKGAHLSVKDRNESEFRLHALPGAMAQAIDGSSSADKVQLYEEALPAPIGYGGSWASEGRLARLNAALKMVEGTREQIRASKESLGNGEGGNTETGSDTVDSFQPDEQ